MVEIINIGDNSWPYEPNKCDNCDFLERSLADEDGDTLVACDSQKGNDSETRCVVDNTVVYRR
jgi:hypothetical protein